MLKKLIQLNNVTMHKTTNDKPKKVESNQISEPQSFLSQMGKKFLLRIDHVFYLRMWKLRCVLKVSYMDLKVTSFFYSHNYTILILY